MALQPLSLHQLANGKSTAKLYQRGTEFTLRESLKFGELKFSHVPQIKKLVHRQGECRVLMEISDTREVINSLL